MVATLSSPRLETGSKAKEGIKLCAEHPEQLRPCSLTSQSASQMNAAAHLANSTSSITLYQIRAISWSLRKPGTKDAAKACCTSRPVQGIYSVNILLWVQRNSTASDDFHSALARSSYLQANESDRSCVPGLTIL